MSPEDLFEKLIALQLKYSIPLEDIYDIYKTIVALRKSAHKSDHASS